MKVGVERTGIKLLIRRWTVGGSPLRHISLIQLHRLKRRRLVGPENNFGEQGLQKYKKESNVDFPFSLLRKRQYWTATCKTKGSFSWKFYDDMKFWHVFLKNIWFIKEYCETLYRENICSPGSFCEVMGKPGAVYLTAFLTFWVFAKFLLFREHLYVLRKQKMLTR
jgi:hypothetical protein